VLAGSAALAAVLAPGQFDIAVEWGADIVEQTPEPVVLGVTTPALSVVAVFALVYILWAYYWAWLKIEGPFTRFWEALVRVPYSAIRPRYHRRGASLSGRPPRRARGTRFLRHFSGSYRTKRHR
jgi:hypothetical protein